MVAASVLRPRELALDAVLVVAAHAALCLIARGSGFDHVSDDDFARVTAMLADADVVAVEVNASCPNLHESIFAHDPNATREVVAAVVGETSLPVFVKLSPNVTDLTEIVSGAPGHLRHGGWLVLEIGSNQGGAVEALLTGAGFVDIEIRHDLAGHDRIAVARRPS